MSDEDDLDEDHDFLRVHMKLAGLAARHVSPEHIDDLLTHYAGSLRAKRTEGLTDDEVEALTDDDHEKFFADYATKNPDRARSPAATTIRPRSY